MHNRYLLEFHVLYGSFLSILNFYIRLKPINNVVIVSGERWRDSATHIHASIVPQTPLPSRLPHNIEQSSMCYTVGPCWLSILNMAMWTCPSFPGDSEGKESASHEGNLGSIPGLGRSPGGGHGNPFQYSCLESPHGERSLVGYSPWGHKDSDMTEWTKHSIVYMSIPSAFFLRNQIYIQWNE